MAEKWWLEGTRPASKFDEALGAEGASPLLAALARSVYQQETAGGRNVAVSTAGARGHMQVMPATFKEVAGKGWSIDDPFDNMRAGIRYLGKMLDRAGGDPELAAVGYYSGPGGMDAARRGEVRRDPTNAKAPTSLEYGRQVVARMGQKAELNSGAGKKAELNSSAQGAAWWKDYPEVTPADKTPPRPAGEAPAPSKRETVSPEGGWAEEKPGIGAELARQVGLTARHAVKGVAALPAMLSDAVTGPINAGLDLVRGEGNGFRFQRAGDALDRVLTGAGLPEPANATERVVGDMAQGMAGAGGMVGAGRVLAGAAGPVARGVGGVLSQGPGLQVASAATGTGAAGVTRESGGGAGAQVAAGLAGGLAPSLVPAAAGAAVRGALRGGDAGAVADQVKAFRDAGVQPTVGQVTGGRVARATESALAKVPGGAGRMSAFAQQQADDLAASVQSLSDDLAPGASGANAGEAIKRGIAAFRDGVRSVQSKLYSTLDKHIPANTRIEVTNTRQALAAMNEGIDGAPGLSAMFKNAKIDGIHKAMLNDLDEAVKAGGTAALPYESLKKLRTLVGAELADNRLVNDVPRAMWSRLYGALSDDLGEAARVAGPQAEQAWSWANTFTRQQMQRLDDLSAIVNRDTPEKVFQAVIQGTAEGDTIAARVIGALPMRERREVAAAVLQRLGRATPGQQNAAGDAFSSETFLTNIARMSEPARKTLLGRTDLKGVLDKINQFATVAGTRREAGRVFANPSGTAPAAAQIGVGSAIAGGAAAAVAGNPVPLMGALSVPAAANLGARAMTSQRLVDMAATPTTLAPGAAGAALGAASRVDALAPPAAEWWLDAPLLDQPAIQPGDLDPDPDPVDTRGQLEMLAEAKTVDDAIKALQDPGETVKTDRQRLADQRDATVAAKQERRARERARLEAIRIRAEEQRQQAVTEALARRARMDAELRKARGLS